MQQRLIAAIDAPIRAWCYHKMGLAKFNPTPIQTQQVLMLIFDHPSREMVQSTQNTNTMNSLLVSLLRERWTHLPNPVTGKKNPPVCQLYHWAHCVRYGDSKHKSTHPGNQSYVMMCKSCHVIICLCCFYYFHTNGNQYWLHHCW